jgi:hypothetical protein
LYLLPLQSIGARHRYWESSCRARARGEISVGTLPIQEQIPGRRLANRIAADANMDLVCDSGRILGRQTLCDLIMGRLIVGRKSELNPGCGEARSLMVDVPRRTKIARLTKRGLRKSN